jgi:AcrR family transcriptional regulator
VPYRLTERGERRRDEMRTRLLDAAERLFARDGFQGTSLRQVVEVAGTSIGNCYFYFPNKEALLRAVVERISLELGAAVERAISSVPPSAWVPVSVYAAVRWMLDRPALGRVLLVEAPTASSRSIGLHYAAERVRRLTAGAPELLRGRPPELVAQAWTGAVVQVVEAAISGLVAERPGAIARFMAGWNLRALGLPEPATVEALAGLDAYISTQEEERR